MTETTGPGVLAGAPAEVALDSERMILGVPVTAIKRPDRLVFVLPLAGAAAGAATGVGAIFQNGVDKASVPVLGILGLLLLVPLVYLRTSLGTIDRAALALLGLCLAGAALLLMLPEWTYGFQINGIIHHSVFSAPLLLLLSTAVGAHSLKSLLGASPSGQDFSLYPWLGLPVFLALAAYAVLLGNIVASGLGGLTLDMLTTAYKTVPASKGGMSYSIGPVGFLNNILGTFLLMVTTLIIAIPPGVGAGVFMSEYQGRLAGLIDFCTQMLRAVSMFVIGAAAFGIVRGMNGWSADSPLSQLVRGSYSTPDATFAENGSFLFAAAVLALLVVPVIAKMTEEGLRSVPRDIREGSVALGATDGHSLRRILLPWAAPNILTGILIAAAEANGSLAVIVYLAGVGEHGVGLTNGVTSLDYAVFATTYGPVLYGKTMMQYRFTAALLLLIVTVGLTVAAMLIQRRSARRYRGSLTAS